MPLPAIDVMIPAIEKDLGTLPYVIDSVRQMVKHPIGRIMVVSPDSAKIKRICRQKNCSFIHENTVLPITKKSISYRSARWERSGWLYQQLLKLGGSRLGSSRYYLVIDADTVLIRPHVFRSGGQTVFYYRNWSQPEYFRTYRKLLGKKANSRKSFVTHYMLFERSRVRELKETIERRHGARWYQAIIGSIDKRKQFGFSEFETYGNYVRDHDSAGCAMRPALNKSLSTSPSALTA